MEAHHDPQPEPCRWCNGTGTYAGPMLNSFYAGPCLVCTPADDDEEDYAEHQQDGGL